MVDVFKLLTEHVTEINLLHFYFMLASNNVTKEIVVEMISDNFENLWRDTQF